MISRCDDAIGHGSCGAGQPADGMIGGQVHGEFCCAASDVGRYGRAEFSKQCKNRRVLHQCDSGEPRDAFFTRPVRQLVQQRTPEPPSFGVVDDGDSNLSDRRVSLRTHEASNAEKVASSCSFRDERLMVVVVNLREVDQLAIRKAGLGAQEPSIARVRAELVEACLQSLLVGGAIGRITASEPSINRWRETFMDPSGALPLGCPAPGTASRPFIVERTLRPRGEGRLLASRFE